jgi:hypothetical protein
MRFRVRAALAVSAAIAACFTLAAPAMAATRVPHTISAPVTRMPAKPGPYFLEHVSGGRYDAPQHGTTKSGEYMYGVPSGYDTRFSRAGHVTLSGPLKNSGVAHQFNGAQLITLPFDNNRSLCQVESASSPGYIVIGPCSAKRALWVYLPVPHTASFKLVNVVATNNTGRGGAYPQCMEFYTRSGSNVRAHGCFSGSQSRLTLKWVNP